MAEKKSEKNRKKALTSHVFGAIVAERSTEGAHASESAPKKIKIRG